MKHIVSACAMLAVLAMPVSASAMTADQFLTKVKALKAKGLFAMGSPDIPLLKNEMGLIIAAYRQDIVAARKAGTTPHSCPPARDSGKAQLSSKDLIADLEAIPPAQRGVSMKTAFYAIMKKRYPCR